MASHRPLSRGPERAPAGLLPGPAARATGANGLVGMYRESYGVSGSTHVRPVTPSSSYTGP
jgi:hypothetical protein